MDDIDLCCPTCSAKQPAAVECRRCKCDLRLYQHALSECRRLKIAALGFLREGNLPAAVAAAERYRTISSDSDAMRLVGVANLLAGRHDAALAAYNCLKRSIEQS